MFFQSLALADALAWLGRAKVTGWAASGAIESPHGSHGHCKQDLQSRLAARSDRPQPARHRFLQATDATDDSGILPEPAGHLFGHQPQPPRPPCRVDRLRTTSPPPRPPPPPP